MDVLTNEQCQEIIGRDHTWEAMDLTKQNGGRLHFNQSECAVWVEQYPLMALEYVMRYEVGDYATLHTDSFWRYRKRYYVAHETWITPLNTGYEGGDLYLDGELIEQVVGVPIKFQILTPHEITEVTAGTRYSLVSWVFVRRIEGVNDVNP
jgi:hypothetical protein